MKKNLYLSILFLLMAQVTIAAPLAKSLAPLPEREYGRIFNAHQAKEKVPIKLLHQGLFAGQTYVRAQSASLLGDYGNYTSVPYLIDALSDQSMHVGVNYIEAGMATTRYRANESLKKLTKKDFGFIWNDPEEKRNESIQKWIEWYRNGSKTKL